MFETIVLKDNEVLEDKEFGSLEFDVLIHVVGDNCVIHNLLVYSPKKDFSRIIKVSGKNCVIKNCRFSSIAVNGPIIVVEHQDEPDNCLIMNNWFYQGQSTKSNNGLEAIRLGESSTCRSSGHNIIYNNRFENWDREIEIVSVKNNDNIILNNEVVNCAGTLTLRHTNNSLVAYNTIDGKNKKDSGGVRVCGDGNVVIGNIIQNTRGSGLRSCVNLMCGVKDYEHHLNRYEPITNCFIGFNTFINCLNVYALGMLKKEADIKPKKVNLHWNLIDRCRNIHTTVKDNVGAVVVTENEVKKHPYNTNVHHFELASYNELYQNIMEFRYEGDDSNVEEEEKEEVEVEQSTEKEHTIALADKITKRLALMVVEKRVIDLQQKMLNTLRETVDLIETFNKLSR